MAGFEKDEGEIDPFFPPFAYDFLERQVRKVHDTFGDVLVTPVISG